MVSRSRNLYNLVHNDIRSRRSVQVKRREQGGIRSDGTLSLKKRSKAPGPIGRSKMRVQVRESLRIHFLCSAIAIQNK